MTIEYTWKILDLETAIDDNLGEVVTSALWELTGVDSDDGIEYTFTTKTSLLDAIQEQFVEIRNATEEMIVQWVEQKSAIEIEDEQQKILETQFVVDHAKKEIQKMIESKRSRKNNLPWQ